MTPKLSDSPPPPYQRKQTTTNNKAIRVMFEQTWWKESVGGGGGSQIGIYQKEKIKTPLLLTDRFSLSGKNAFIRLHI